MDNEQRAELLLRKYGFDFDKISPKEITELIQKEIENFQEGSAEYIRVLCGYLYCIGDASNVCLIKKAKYEINFDVQCMIDDEWIESLEKNDQESKKELIDGFVSSKNTQAATLTSVTSRARKPKKYTAPTRAGSNAITTSRMMVLVETGEWTWGELEIVSS